MNTELQESCKLFVENRDLIQKAFKWESSYMMPACSLLFTGMKAKVNVELMKECNDILKKEVSAFSYLRGNTKLILLSKMTLTSSPKQYVEQVLKVYEQLKLEGLYGSDYAVLAAMIIVDEHGEQSIDDIIAQIGVIYKKMKKNHPFLTSSEDVPFATLLAMSELSDEKVLEDMEACYQILKPVFHSANGVQSLSHVLALDERDAKTKCDAVIDLYNRFKAERESLDYNTIAVFGSLIMLGLDNETIVKEVCEVSDWLVTQKGFGNFFGTGQRVRLLYAAALVMEHYSDHCLDTEATVLTGTVAVMVAAEMAMIAAIAAANAAATASN